MDAADANVILRPLLTILQLRRTMRVARSASISFGACVAWFPRRALLVT